MDPPRGALCCRILLSPNPTRSPRLRPSRPFNPVPLARKPQVSSSSGLAARRTACPESPTRHPSSASGHRRLPPSRTTRRRSRRTGIHADRLHDPRPRTRRTASAIFPDGAASGRASSHPGRLRLGDERPRLLGRPRRHIARFILVGIYTGTRTDRIEQASFYPEPGRPYVDVDAGIYYRAAAGEFVPDNKRAGPVRIPPRLLGHFRRWKKNGARYVVEWHGKPVGTASAYFRNQRETLTETEIKAHRLNRHALKHTCATWLMLAAEELADIASFMDTDEKTVVRHYGHHHPDHQAGIGLAFSRGAGKVRFGKEAKATAPERPTAANTPAVAAEVRRSIRELLDMTKAPVVAFGLVDITPDAGLEALRESVKRAFQSGDWSGLLGENAA